jgi:hypothetical protein
LSSGTPQKYPCGVFQAVWWADADEVTSSNVAAVGVQYAEIVKRLNARFDTVDTVVGVSSLAEALTTGHREFLFVSAGDGGK